MPYFTIEQVHAAAAENLSRAGMANTFANATTQLVKEASNQALPPIPEQNVTSPPVLFDIFLSHSSLDQIQVLGLYHLLRSRNYTVYLDRICDPQLNPAQVTRATARVLRYRMAQCRSLFVATSTNTTQSKWVPWELGFMDGWNAKAAVLPIVPAHAPTFKGHEYFELYPEVRNAPAGQLHPNDLEIYDLNNLLGPWGQWLTMTRTF